MVDTKAATVDSAYVLTAFSYLIILSRLALRRFKHETFKVDDYLMWFAMVLYFINTAVYPLAVYAGDNVNMHPKDMLPEEVERVSYGLKWLFIGRPFYISYLWVLKTCLLIFYTRLTERKLEVLVIKCVGGVLAATWFASLLTLFLGCRPLHLVWQVIPETPGCAKAVAAVYVVGLSNIFTDLLLMVIPLHIIARTLLPLKTKIELGAIFALGLFAISIVVLRMTITLTHWKQQNRLIWGQLECFTSTIVANAPILHGLWRHAWIHIRKFNFKQNDNCPPLYNMSLQRPTEQTEVEQATNDNLSIPETRGARARQSFRRIKDRLRQSLDAIEIERSVELLQETKTGRFERGSREDNQFAGLTSVAQIITHIETGLTVDSKGMSKKKLGLLRMSRSTVGGHSSEA